MREEDRWDEPHCIKDARKAVGYYAAWGFVGLCLLILFGGMICPLFWGKVSRVIDQCGAEADKDWQKKYPNAAPMDVGWIVKLLVAIAMGIWCIASWAFFIYTQTH